MENFDLLEGLAQGSDTMKTFVRAEEICIALVSYTVIHIYTSIPKIKDSYVISK